MKALLRRFIELIEVELLPAGFVRRGSVYRYFDPAGNGIVLEIQRTTALLGQAEFYINVGLLLAPHVRFGLGDRDPRRAALPLHGIWQHRLTAWRHASIEIAGDPGPGHRFTLAAQADAERAAAIVVAWLADNLPALKSQLDLDEMLAAADNHRERSERARDEQLAAGRWQPGRWPDGNWHADVLRAYACAERGDPDAVAAQIADWPAHWKDGPGSFAEDVVALANRRATERHG